MLCGAVDPFPTYCLTFLNDMSCTLRSFIDLLQTTQLSILLHHPFHLYTTFKNTLTYSLSMACLT